MGAGLPRFAEKGHHVHRSPLVERRAVTLCLALLCRQNDTELEPSSVLIISDQLITEGDTAQQYEMPQLKAVVMRPGSVQAYLAGNLDLCQQVCRAAMPEVHAGPITTVEGVARLLSGHVQNLIRDRFQHR